MKEWWKIITVILIAGVIIWFLICYLGKSEDHLKNALSKLDSTQQLLDTARAYVSNSKHIIGNLQDSLNAYSLNLAIMRSKVDVFNSQRRVNETNFNQQISKDNSKYNVKKKDILKHQRTFWPEIVIDTTP